MCSCLLHGDHRKYQGHGEASNSTGRERYSRSHILTTERGRRGGDEADIEKNMRHAKRARLRIVRMVKTQHAMWVAGMWIERRERAPICLPSFVTPHLRCAFHKCTGDFLFLLQTRIRFSVVPDLQMLQTSEFNNNSNGSCDENKRCVVEVQS